MKRAFVVALCLGPLAHLLQADIMNPETPALVRSLPSHQRRARTFSEPARGWYWVYQGVAHAQSFTASGSRIERLWLRPAQLNASRPAAALRVEIRDLSLRTLYAQGHIRPEELDREFRWIPAEISYRAGLTAGSTYVLLLSSAGSEHTGPWILNATYRDLYPAGRHLGYADDLLFRVSFEVEELWVGPGQQAFVVPINSGLSAAPRKAGPPSLVGRYPAVREAANDPQGPLPRCEKAKLTGMSQR